MDRCWAVLATLALAVGMLGAGGATALVTSTEVVLPEPRYTFGAVWDQEERVGYLLGGAVELSNILRVDPKEGTVVEVGSLPSIRDGNCAAWDPASRSAYHFFGWMGRDGGRMTNEIVRFRPDTGAVEVVATHSRGNSHCGAVWDAAKGVAYVFGGDRVGMTDEIGLFDPEDNSYTILDVRLPSARSHFSASWDPVARNAYVVGGWQGGHARLDEVVRFTPDTGEVAVVARTPTPLSDPATFFAGKHLYILGGHPDCCSVTTAILRFDPDSGELRTLSDRLAVGRAGAAAYWDGREALVLGGGNDASRVGERFVPAQPSLRLELTGTRGSGDWFITPVDALVSQATGSFGLAEVQVSDGDAWVTIEGSVTRSGEGRHLISTRAVDIEGNVWEGPAEAFGIDTEPPESIVGLQGLKGVESWFRSAVDVELDGMDATSGYSHSWYAVGSADPQQGNGIHVDTEGRHLVTYWAVDVASNAEVPRTLAVNLDLTPPKLSMATPRVGSVYVNGNELRSPEITPLLGSLDDAAFGSQPDVWVAGWVEVRAVAVDPGQQASGIHVYEVRVDGQPVFRTGAATSFVWDVRDVTPGIHTLEVMVQDRAGNHATQSLVVRVFSAAMLAPG